MLSPTAGVQNIPCRQSRSNCQRYAIRFFWALIVSTSLAGIRPRRREPATGKVLLCAAIPRCCQRFYKPRDAGTPAHVSVDAHSLSAAEKSPVGLDMMHTRRRCAFVTILLRSLPQHRADPGHDVHANPGPKITTDQDTAAARNIVKVLNRAGNDDAQPLLRADCILELDIQECRPAGDAGPRRDNCLQDDKGVADHRPGGVFDTRSGNSPAPRGRATSSFPVRSPLIGTTSRDRAVAQGAASGPCCAPVHASTRASSLRAVTLAAVREPSTASGPERSIRRWVSSTRSATSVPFSAAMR